MPRHRAGAQRDLDSASPIVSVKQDLFVTM